MSLAVRGLFGEGTEAASDLYQLSNQVTLGVSESQIVSQFEEAIIPEIVEYENVARNRLLSGDTHILDDKISILSLGIPFFRDFTGRTICQSKRFPL